MILNLTRKISENNRSVKDGGWEKFQGINIEKKKVGVVGLGKIGSQLIKYFKSFNVMLYGNDNKKSVCDKFEKKRIKILSLNKIFLRVRGLANSFLSKFVHSINQIIILWTMYLNISMAFSKA